MPPEEMAGPSVGFVEDFLQPSDEFEKDPVELSCVFGAATIATVSEEKPLVHPIRQPFSFFDLEISESANPRPAGPRPSLAGRPPCEWLGGPLGGTPRGSRRTSRVELTPAEWAAQQEAVAIVAASLADGPIAGDGVVTPHGDRSSYSWSEWSWLEPSYERCQGDVVLSVYDATRSPLVSAFNRASAPVGAGGAFHIAIVVWDHEWSFGLTRSGSGVSWVSPGQDAAHQFRGSLLIGTTRLPRKATHRIIKQMAKEWQGNLYHPLRRNCCHFAQSLAASLGVGPLPDWVDRLGRTCETLSVPIDEAVASGRRVLGTLGGVFRLALMPWQACCGKDGAVVLAKSHETCDPASTTRPLGPPMHPSRATAVEWC